MALKIGDQAPDFELPAVVGDQQSVVKMSDFRGKRNLVITFHPMDWTPVCAHQVPELDSRRKEFQALDAEVIDVSVDSLPSHKAWRKNEVGEVQIPLGSDFYPHGAVSKAFGVLREGPPLPGISERAAFIVDKSGKIAFAKVYPLDVAPKVQELLDALQKLNGA